MENALYGSFLPHPAKDLFSLPAESEYEETSVPGAMSVAKVGKIVLNEGRRRVTLKVTNIGDRPIQVNWRSISATRRTVLSERVFSAANRSGRTIISSKPTRSSILTGLRRMGTTLTCPLGRLCALSQVTPRQLSLSILAVTKSLGAAAVLHQDPSTHLVLRKSFAVFSRTDSPTRRPRQNHTSRSNRLRSTGRRMRQCSAPQLETSYDWEPRIFGLESSRIT